MRSWFNDRRFSISMRFLVCGRNAPISSSLSQLLLPLLPFRLTFFERKSFDMRYLWLFGVIYYSIFDAKYTEAPNKMHRTNVRTIHRIVCWLAGRIATTHVGRWCLFGRIGRSIDCICLSCPVCLSMAFVFNTHKSTCDRENEDQQRMRGDAHNEEESIFTYSVALLSMTKCWLLHPTETKTKTRNHNGVQSILLLPACLYRIVSCVRCPPTQSSVPLFAATERLLNSTISLSVAISSISFILINSACEGYFISTDPTHSVILTNGHCAMGTHSDAKMIA